MIGGQRDIPCDVMRGGTSKGLVFLADNLPADAGLRDRVLLAAMGSPDPRQIDGLGGAHPLASKVAVVSRSARTDADVEYLFLQVWPDRAQVSDSQNCGNMLAAVGPFAIEHGLVAAMADVTPVRIWMCNTQSLATSYVSTPDREGKRTVEYAGNARIDGVPGTHSAIPIEFSNIAGSTCGALLPSGNVMDIVHGIAVTCIDNGMPVVCINAADVGLSGDESPTEIESRTEVLERIEDLRLACGVLMNLGDVTSMTVPKVGLLSAAKHGGTISTRTLIPHRVHESIGVLGAVSVATACTLLGSVAAAVAAPVANHFSPNGRREVDVEHPNGFFTIRLESDPETGLTQRVSLLRTARLLMRGQVMVPGEVWPTGAAQ